MAFIRYARPPDPVGAVAVSGKSDVTRDAGDADGAFVIGGTMDPSTKEPLPLDADAKVIEPPPTRPLVGSSAQWVDALTFSQSWTPSVPPWVTASKVAF